MREGAKIITDIEFTALAEKKLTELIRESGCTNKVEVLLAINRTIAMAQLMRMLTVSDKSVTAK